ncbi:MAG: FAD-binding oxidoreductase [Candidatus Thorarchaeota archaeon]
MIDQSTKLKLKNIVGEKYITDDPVELYCYSHDNVSRALSWVDENYDLKADLVIKPENADQIIQLVDIANEENLKIIPRGAGTSYGGQFLPIEGGVILDFTRMNKILEINAKDNYAIVQPGVLFKNLGKALKKTGKGYWIPCNPGSADVCTIGGMIGNDASGESAIKYGTTKDYVLSLKVILGTGKSIQIGNLVHKTVSGLDLKSLFVGSEGTLGIMTEVTLKILAIPQSFKTVIGYFESIEEAVHLAKKIRDMLTPMSLELLDRITILGMNAFLSRLTPKITIKNSDAALLIRLDGDREITSVHASKIIEVLSADNNSRVTEIFEGIKHQFIWKARDNAGPSIGRLTPSVKTVGTFFPASMDFSVPFSKTSELMNKFAKIVGAYNIGFIRYGHLGDGNVHLICSTPIKSEEDIKKFSSLQGDLVKLALSLGGSVTAEHGCGVWKAPYLPLEHGEDVIRLMQNIKDVFDPNNILNPSKLYSFPKKISIFSNQSDQIGGDMNE